MMNPASYTLIAVMLLGLSPLRLPGQTPSFPSVKDYGAAGDGVADDLPAFNAAITASVQQGSSVYPVRGIVAVPPGTYFLNGTLVLNNAVHLIGNGSGQEGGNWASTLKFPVDTGGIRVTKANPATSQNGADGSIIEGLMVLGSGGVSATAHGIEVKAPVKIRDCSVSGFRGNGIDIVTSAILGTNAGRWCIDTVTLKDNGGHGLYTSGASSIDGLATSLFATNNGGWGIYDSSAQGNTYVGCRASGNGLGAYKAGQYAKTLFFGCQSDGGQPGSEIPFPSIVLGGAFHEISGSGYFLLKGEVPSVTARNTALTATLTIGMQDSGSLLGLKDVSFPWWPFRLKYIPGGWFLDWANLNDGRNLYLFNRTATPANGYPRDLSAMDGALGLTNGYYGGDMKYRGEGNAPPASGTWLRGDIIHNLLPSAGGYAGWVCVVGGTPGTWKGFGMLQP
jgi:hypothetical protein